MTGARGAMDRGARGDRYSDAPDAPVLLECRALEIGHTGPILPPIDLRIGKGELWVVVGRNGSGKTTWFRTVLGLLRPIRGAILTPMRGLRRSYVPQRTAHDALFPLLAREVVAMGIDRGWSFARPWLRDPRRVDRVLEEAGAAGLANEPYHRLSEGQKQRVLLARLAASAPHLALLDEPTAAMDAVAERSAFEYLSRLRRERQTAIVVVSHYLGMVREYADRAVFLDRDTSTVVVGRPAEMLAHPAFQRSYGAAPEAAGRA